MANKAIGFQRFDGASQLFVRRHQNGNVRMLCAKVTDEFLISRCAKNPTWFDKVTRQRFIVGKNILSGRMNFNCAIVEQNVSGDITLSMEAYMKRSQPISIDRERRKNQEGELKPTELTQYSGLAGILNWAARAAIPVGCFAASYMQQKLGMAQVKHICSANGMLAEIHTLSPLDLFKCPQKPVL